MHKFWLFIAVLSIVASQSRATDFNKKKDALLKKANISYDVAVSTAYSMQSPIIAADLQSNILRIALRKDLVDSCTEDERLFFVVSMSIAHQKIEELGWKLHIPSVGMLTSSVITASALTTALAYKMIKPDALSKENVLHSMLASVLGALFGLHGNIAAISLKTKKDCEGSKLKKTWKEVISLDILAPLAGVLIGVSIAGVGVMKYASYLMAKGDKLAASLVGNRIAISALKKAKSLPVSSDNWLVQKAQSMTNNFENRMLALV